MQYYREEYEKQACAVRQIKIRWTGHAPVIRWVVSVKRLVIVSDLIARALATSFIFLFWLYFSRQEQRNDIGSISYTTGFLLLGGALHWTFPIDTSSVAKEVADLLVGLFSRVKRFVAAYAFVYELASYSSDPSETSEMLRVREILRSFFLVYCAGGGILSKIWHIIYQEFRYGITFNVSWWFGVSTRDEGVDSGSEQTVNLATDPWSEFANAVQKLALNTALSLISLHLYLPPFLPNSARGFSVKALALKYVRFLIVNVLLHVAYLLLFTVLDKAVSAGFLEPFVDRNLLQLAKETFRANQAERSTEGVPPSESNQADQSPGAIPPSGTNQA